MKAHINLTYSKLMATGILIIGAGYSFYTKEAHVITLAITVAAGLLGWKQQKDKEKEQIQKGIK